MQTKYTDLVFIDRPNFTQLQSRDLSLDDIAYVYLDRLNISEDVRQKKDSKFSYLTKALLVELDQSLQKTIFDSYYYNEYIQYGDIMSEHDKKYIKHYVKEFLVSNTDNTNEVSVNAPVPGSDEKYYEIIPYEGTSGSKLFVVVNEGFFENLTKCKSELLNFILDCLSYQYKTGVYMGYLLKRYLSVKINEAQFDLVKLRFSSAV